MVLIGMCDLMSKSMVFCSLNLRISHAERFKVNVSFFTLKNNFKINRINSCFCYYLNHPYNFKKYIPISKNSLYCLDLETLKLPPLFDR